jgi:hypothetical protein
VTGTRPEGLSLSINTVRELDLVLGSMADGRLHRAALRKLPPWRAVVLARVARRAGLMLQHELDTLIAEAIEVGPDGKLRPYPGADARV